MFFIRLTRIVPFVAFLALIAALIYFIARFRLPSAHAKYIVIKFFTIICAVLSVALILVTLYGLLDGNTFAAELFGSFFAAAALGLVIVLICRWRFLKKYPQYAEKAQMANVHGVFHQIKTILNNLKTIFGPRI